MKCLDKEDDVKAREEMMRAIGAAVHDDENAELCVRNGLVEIVKREIKTKHATLIVENLGVRDKYKTKLMSVVEDLVTIGAERTLKVLRDTSAWYNTQFRSNAIIRMIFIASFLSMHSLLPPLFGRFRPRRRPAMLQLGD